MTKNEILMELETVINGFGFDNNELVIIGKASEVLCTGKEDPSMENIEVWVEPNYYDTLIENEDYGERLREEGQPTRNMPFSYNHCDEKHGEIKLYYGNLIGSRPKSKQIAGFNVQVFIQEGATARIIDFK